MIKFLPILLASVRSLALTWKTGTDLGSVFG
jgi:hypothetical protein